MRLLPGQNVEEKKTGFQGHRSVSCQSIKTTETGISQCPPLLPLRNEDEEVILALPLSLSLVAEARLWLTPHHWCTAATAMIEIRGRECLSCV